MTCANPHDVAHPHAWLWQDGDEADVELLIVSDADDGTVATLRLHSLVLGSASPAYFRAHLKRLAREAKEHQQVTTSVSTSAVSPQHHAAPGTTHSPAPEAPAAHVPRSPQPTAPAATAQAGPATEQASPAAATAQTGPATEQASAPEARTEPGPATLRADTPQPEAPEAKPGEPQQQQSDSSRPTKRARLTARQQIRPTTAFIKTLEITLHPGEPHTVPEAVLCHVYTGSLPDDPSKLAWMLWRADYLDLAATVTAIVSKLQSLADNKQLTVADAILLEWLPELQTTTGATDTRAQLRSITQGVLVHHFSAATDILTQQPLLEQFTQLPLPLVKQWVQLPTLQYDSANTLAVLFTAWHDAQPSPPTEEQCQELSALLPLSSFTLCYHLQVLPRLKWWRAKVLEEGVPNSTGLLHALCLLLPKDKGLQSTWSSIVNSGRPSSALSAITTPITYTRNLTYTELQQLWREDYFDLDPVVAMGYKWCLYLDLQHSETEAVEDRDWQVDLRSLLEWPAPVEDHARASDVALSQPSAHVHVTGTLTWLSGTEERPPVTGTCVTHYWQCGTWGCPDVLNRGFKDFSDLCPSRSTTLTVHMSWQCVTTASAPSDSEPQ